METLQKQFLRARKAGTPLMVIKCFDPAATMDNIQEEVLKKIDSSASKGIDKVVPIIQWDIIRGWRGRNSHGGEVVLAVHSDDPQATMNPVEMLEIAYSHLPQESILFILNGHLHLDDKKPDFLQALWNLRDTFKSSGRTAVILCPQVILPPELENDILVLDERLPSPEDLGGILDELMESVQMTLTDEERDNAISAIVGLSAFPAEQAVAMCISKEGLDIESLWERKKQYINDTPGLSIWNDGIRFDDLGGLAWLKERFSRIMNGKAKPKVIVWIDEIEKAMAGAGTDSSGVATDQLGVILNEMQERQYNGSIFVGVPGTAKSAFAKALGNEAGIITIKLDLGAMKDKFVGTSEQRIRQVMKIIYAVAGIGGAFFVATSNNIKALRPELKRRFKKGIWYFDLPSEAERLSIWELFLAKYELNEDPKSLMSLSTDWTGAEIESCCQTAYEESISILEASATIIPVSRSACEEIEALRNEAHGKYADVSNKGVYKRVDTNLVETSKAKTSRRIG